MKTKLQKDREKIANDIEIFLANGGKITEARVMTESERIAAITANRTMTRSQKLYAINKLRSSVSKG